MKEDCLCKMLCVYMCVHRYLYFEICCRQEVGRISSHCHKNAHSAHWFPSRDEFHDVKLICICVYAYD